MPIGEMKGKSDPAGRASQTLHTQTLIHRFQVESHKVSQSFPRCRLTGWCEDPEAGGCRPGLWPQALLWSQVSQWERTCLPIQEMPRDRGLIPGSGRSGEGMAIPSSILAWKIPWREEPGWLLSMGSQRARPDLTTEHTCYRDPSDTGDLRSIHLEWSRKQGVMGTEKSETYSCPLPRSLYSLTSALMCISWNSVTEQSSIPVQLKVLPPLYQKRAN